MLGSLIFYVIAFLFVVIPLLRWLSWSIRQVANGGLGILFGASSILIGAALILFVVFAFPIPITTHK